GDEEVRDLTSRTRLSVSLFDVGSPHLPPECSDALHQLTDREPVAVRPLDGQTVIGATRIPDIFGHPLLLMRVAEPRSVYRAGVQNVAVVAALIALAAGVFSVMAVLMLERFVLSRLTSLTTQVQRIKTHGTLSARIILT